MPEPNIIQLKPNKGGRPKKLKKKEIEQLGKDLLEWFNQDDKNFLIKEFASINNLHSGTFTEWAGKYPKFAECYKLAKELQEVRMVKGMLKPGSSITGFIFAAKNLIGYRDRADSGDTGLNQDDIIKLKQAAKEQAKLNA